MTVISLQAANGLSDAEVDATVAFAHRLIDAGLARSVETVTEEREEHSVFLTLSDFETVVFGKRALRYQVFRATEQMIVTETVGETLLEVQREWLGLFEWRLVEALDAVNHSL